MAGFARQRYTFFRYPQLPRDFYFLLLRGRNDRHVRSVFVGSLEFDDTVTQSEQGVILAHADVFAGVVDSTSLADDDVASFGELTTEDLQT